MKYNDSYLHQGLPEVSDPNTYADLEIRILEKQERGYPVEITFNGDQEFPRGFLDPSAQPQIERAYPKESGALRQSNAPPQILSGHQGLIRFVAFAPDGNRLASGADRNVRVWDLRQPNAPPQVLSGHQGIVNSVAFAPDGNRLASASADKTIRIWPLWSAAADYLCTRVWRNLSMEEWKFYIGESIPYERTCPALPPGFGASDGPR